MSVFGRQQTRFRADRKTRIANVLGNGARQSDRPSPMTVETRMWSRSRREVADFKTSAAFYTGGRNREGTERRR